MAACGLLRARSATTASTGSGIHIGAGRLGRDQTCRRGVRMRSRQRGVALVTAVLIVALATILAVDVGFKAYLDQRRTATTFAIDESFEVALGGEAWAADTLRRDKIQS